MEDNGLASSMINSEAGAAPQDEMQLILNEVIRLLSEGVSPDELVEMGVPPEIIEQAMAALKSPKNGSMPVDGGLASSMM